MIKRRCLTRIRVSANAPTIVDGENANTITTTATTNEGCNTNCHDVNGRSDTTNVSNDETRMQFDSDILRSLSHSDEIDYDESDTPQQSVICCHLVKCGGPTILADIWNQSPEEKWVVKFNKEGEPYGDESSLLASFIGTIGRNPEMAPQGYSDWRLVPKEYKVKCMNEIKLRFSFPRSGEDHIRKALGRTVKDFRGELKATYYEPNKHNRAALVNAKPPRVPRDQWLKLLSYWVQDKTKVYSLTFIITSMVVTARILIT
ncbi:hypothetical protein RND81_03G042100 [Saponaria officinalis]|uniref:Transposase n=1 Tax=Saponaria officinalis TaxID=3572 RepID=A0AAW1LY45_SAPOF